MALSAKKRFSVLQRDGFRCKYCGQNSSHASFEVDHIIPKSQGGGDEVENLVTCCRTCNSGKRDKTLQEVDTELWKIKLTDFRDKIRKEFTKQWNNRSLGNIDEKTFKLLCIFVRHYTKDIVSLFMYYGDEYEAIIAGYEECINRKSVYTETNCNVFECKFKEGGEYCDEFLDYTFQCIFDDGGQYCGNMLDILWGVCEENGNKWTQGKEKWEGEYFSKLNYCLTEELLSLNEYEFVVKKFTLHSHLLTKSYV